MTNMNSLIDNSQTNIEIVEINNAFYKSFQMYGQNPEQDAWKEAFIWEKYYQQVLGSVEKTYLGFYNPAHDYEGKYRGFAACLFLDIPISSMKINELNLQKFTGRNYAKLDKKFTDDLTNQKMLFDWLNKNNFELDVSVHFEEFEFLSGSYNQCISSKQLFPFIKHSNKQNGDIVFLPTMVCLAHKCCHRGIDQGVQWYVNQWCMTHKDMSYYTGSRVFITVLDDAQYCMVLYPPDTIPIENNIDNSITIGGKYLRFKCNAMLLRRMIPKYMKHLMHCGYQLDKNRFFFEEHFKHCEKIEEMLMAYMYFPIY